MKCPMKFADGSRRASQTECEREDCAWWVERIGENGAMCAGCAVMLAQAPTAVYESSYVLAKE